MVYECFHGNTRIDVFEQDDCIDEVSKLLVCQFFHVSSAQKLLNIFVTVDLVVIVD